jgi:membrane protein YqaA with SNARE-associated domain
MGKVNKTALAATLAVIYGIILFAICLVSTISGWAKEVTTVYSSLFPGVSATITGSVIAAIYGVVFGAVLGYVIGVLYNYFSERIKK